MKKRNYTAVTLAALVLLAVGHISLTESSG